MSPGRLERDLTALCFVRLESTPVLLEAHNIGGSKPAIFPNNKKVMLAAAAARHFDLNSDEGIGICEHVELLAHDTPLPSWEYPAMSVQ